MRRALRGICPILGLITEKLYFYLFHGTIWKSAERKSILIFITGDLHGSLDISKFSEKDRIAGGLKICCITNQTKTDALCFTMHLLFCYDVYHFFLSISLKNIKK